MMPTYAKKYLRQDKIIQLMQWVPNLIFFLFNYSSESLKSQQHRTSSYFQNKITKCNVFEIPQFSETRCSIPQNLNKKAAATIEKSCSSIEKEKRKKSISKTQNEIKKNIKTKDASVNTKENISNDQSTQIKVNMIDATTQTNIEESEKEDHSAFSAKNDFYENKDATLKNNENHKTIMNSNSITTSEIDNSTDKKRLTKFEIENLFKSVKNMIIGVKEKDSMIQEKSRMSSFQSSFLSKHLDIQNLKDSTDHLIQKLENIKRSKDEGNLKQSLQSSDFMLSRSETFSNLDPNSNFNNNLQQKASNILESKLIDSCFSNGNPNVNEFNITKSIDFIEKMLNSQVFGNGLATKESKFSNNFGVSNIENTDEQNFYSDVDNDCELFQSHFLSSCKNLFEDPNNTNNFPIYYIGNQKTPENPPNNKEKIMIFDQENVAKNNHEIMVKYGSGIEKIDERAEEFTYSPNSKNNLLKFNSKKTTPNSANILKERNNKFNPFLTHESSTNPKFFKDESSHFFNT